MKNLTYLFLFTYVFIYSYLIRLKKNENECISFILGYLPIAILLIMTLGLQYDVGTDYYSYLSLADGSKNMSWIANRSEILFISLVQIIIKIGNPQMLFVLVGSIQVLFLLLITYELKKLNLKLHNFFFLYFTLSLTFFNQFNGIRQYIAVYIVVYAFIKLINEKKILFVSLIILASLFHSSAIYFLPFIILGRLLKKRVPIKIVILISGILIIVSMIEISKFIEILLSFTSYKSYIGSNYFGRMPIKGIITKLPKLIVVLYSSYLIDKKDLVEKEVELLNLGYIGIFVLIMSFTSTLIWRFYQYVDLFIVFPVLILFNEEKYKTIKIVISILLFIMLIVKIIVIPKGEYAYQSIIFR